MKLNTDTLTHILLYTDKLREFLNLCRINREGFQLYKSFTETIYKNLYEHKYTLLCDFHHEILDKARYPFDVAVYRVIKSYKIRPYVLRASHNENRFKLTEESYLTEYSEESPTL
jgi:hypothetical protein